MEKRHGVDIGHLGRRLGAIIVPRVARPVIQRQQPAGVPDAVKRRIDRDRIAQQNAGADLAVNAQRLAVDRRIAGHRDLGIVPQAQRIGQEGRQIGLADGLLFFQLERAADDRRHAGRLAIQARLNGGVGAGRRGHRQGRSQGAARRGIRRDAEFIDQLNPFARQQGHGRGQVDQGLLPVDAAIAVQIQYQPRVTDQPRADPILDRKQRIQRDIAGIPDIEIILRHRAAGQKQVGMAADIQVRHRQNLCVDRVGEDLFHNPQSGVEIGGFGDIADDGAAGCRGRHDKLREENKHQRDEPDQRHRAEACCVKKTAHQLAP